MPMSNPWHLPAVLHFATALNPSRVLDVGIGMGAYGLMIRQHCDIAHERLSRKSWKMTIDGVEVFDSYRNPIWDYAYDNVWIGDALKVVPTLGHYDLIVCNDMLEHLPAPDATAFAKTLLEHSPVVIATTPNHDCPQGDWGGNEAEIHRSFITASVLPNVAAQWNAPVTSCYVLARDSPHATAVRNAALGCPRIAAPLGATLGHRIQRRVRRLIGVG